MVKDCTSMLQWTDKEMSSDSLSGSPGYATPPLSCFFVESGLIISTLRTHHHHTPQDVPGSGSTDSWQY